MTTVMHGSQQLMMSMQTLPRKRMKLARSVTKKLECLKVSEVYDLKIADARGETVVSRPNQQCTRCRTFQCSVSVVELQCWSRTQPLLSLTSKSLYRRTPPFHLYAYASRVSISCWLLVSAQMCKCTIVIPSWEEMVLQAKGPYHEVSCLKFAYIEHFIDLTM